MLLEEAFHYLGDLGKGLRAATKETCSLEPAPTEASA